MTNKARIPRGIWALGFVSLLMDVSSELIHSLLPLFMLTVLGMSMLTIGLIEGAAEATALIADLAPPAVRGAAFGLRQALDTVGAFLGPLLAMALMLLWANDFRAVFWVAVIPAFLAVALLLFGVREPGRAPGAPRVNPIRMENLRRLGRAYWSVVGIGALFTLARFSEAFLILRAHQLGMPLAYTPLVLIGMNLVYASCAYPFGKLSDSIRRSTLLALGLAVLIAADLALARPHAGWFAVGVALWGLHMGMTQGLLAAMVADTAPADLRGTAFGFFNLASGCALFIASALAGLLWDGLGAPATFIAGAAFSAVALAGLLLSQRRRG